MNANHDSITTVRARLVARRQELQHRVSRVSTDLGHGNAPLSADFADRAIETSNEEVLERIGTSAQDELRQLEMALQRIDAGHYGDCSTCHGEIEPARLAAVPYAVTCRRCAEA